MRTKQLNQIREWGGIPTSDIEGVSLNAAQVELKCPSCAVTFIRKWAILRQTRGVKCQACSRLVQTDDTRNDKLKEIQKTLDESGTVVISNNFESSHHKLELLCKCGVRFKQSWSDIRSIQRAGRPNVCPTCARKRRSQMHCITPEQAKAFIDSVGCALESEYMDYTSKLAIRCPCSNVWNVSLKDFTNNRTYVCPSCSCNDHQSIGEQQVSAFLEKLGYTPERGNRHILDGFEVDIQIPSRQFAIEYNGGYFHSEQFGRGKDYHLQKTEELAKVGIQLMHVWDYDWNSHRRPIVESMIRIALKHESVRRIAARKTTGVNIQPSVAAKFLKEHHLHGAAGGSIHHGLVVGSELVAVAVYGTHRFKKHNRESSVELIRLAFKRDTIVMGGFEKLIRFLANNTTVECVESYVDRTISNGNSYFRVGFQLIGTTDPGYRYIKSNRIYSRQKFQKHKLEKTLPVFDSTLSERENMANNGFFRIWDCGHYTFKLTIEPRM